jgi:transcriptional regulator with XRE-family HTH domain
MAARLGQNVSKSKTKLGQSIRVRRLELGLSQEKLAKELGVTKQYVSKVELGSLRINPEDVTVTPERRSAYRKRKPRLDTVGGFLYARRLELNISLEALAKRVGIGPHKLKRVESSYSWDPDLLRRIAAELDCEIPRHIFRAHMRKVYP